MQVAPRRIYLMASGVEASTNDRMTLRFHFDCFGKLGSQIFVETAQIPTRTLASVGGVRENRRFSRHKARKHGYGPRTITPMMLVAVANELAARRAKNKAAVQSRRINRRGGK